MAAHTLKPGRGTFITFEGGEGVGKSTQIERLAERLTAAGIDFILTREPGGTAEGEAIRRLLKDLSFHWSPLSETLLNSAARAEHVAKRIRPALDNGRWVLCDRYYDSTIAYQGIVGSIDLELIDRLNRLASGGLRPDVTFLLDLDPNRAQERLKDRDQPQDHYDDREQAFHRKLRKAYQQLADQEPDRFVTVNTDRPKSVVEEEIWSTIAARFLANQFN